MAVLLIVFTVDVLSEKAGEDTQSGYDSQLASGDSHGESNSDGKKPEDNEPDPSDDGTKPDVGEDSESESEPEKEEVQIVMVGDMLMHTRIIESGLRADGTYNYEHLFKNVDEFIQAADVAIVNQETIMGGAELGYSGYPRFNTPYALADAEVKAGFDVILHATNHTTDKGKEAVLNCMNYWDENFPEVDYLGVNRTKEEQDNNIYIREENGIKIAILNYTYTVNGGRMPADMPFLVNLMDEQKVIADIKKAEELADFTIVCPHWGTEYNLGISSYQKKWTKLFLENGVDLVLGTHPHVIEPVEWVTDDDGNKMLVYYSLGNFVNGTSSTGSGVTNRMLGGMADVTIGRNEAGEVVVLEHNAIPIVCHIGEGDAYTAYFLEDYTTELAKENKILAQDSEFSKELCEALVKQVWGDGN